MEFPACPGKGLSLRPGIREIRQIDEFEEMDRTELSVSEVLRLAGYRQGILDDQVGFLRIHMPCNPQGA